MHSPAFINTQIEHYEQRKADMTDTPKMYTQEYFYVSNQLKYWKRRKQALLTGKEVDV